MATLILGKLVIELNLTPSWWQRAMLMRPAHSAEIVTSVVALLWPQLRQLTELRMTPTRIVACVMVPADDTDLSALNTRAQALVNQLEKVRVVEEAYYEKMRRTAP